MTFLVEDGTGLPDSTSYVDTAYADAYFLDRGNAVWAAVATDELKQSCLIQATDYIDRRWGAFLKDQKLLDDQALEFPRWNGCGDKPTEVDLPVNLQKACCEYALRAIAGPLAPDVTRDPSGYQMTSKLSKVGPITSSKSYAEGGAQNVLPQYPAADMLMREFVKALNGRVIRN